MCDLLIILSPKMIGFVSGLRHAICSIVRFPYSKIAFRFMAFFRLRYYFSINDLVFIVKYFVFSEGLLILLICKILVKMIIE